MGSIKRGSKEGRGRLGFEAQARQMYRQSVAGPPRKIGAEVWNPKQVLDQHSAVLEDVHI